MQVSINFEKSNAFNLMKGIYQGDPLSPYIFVLCIEKLAHVIQESIDSGECKPVLLYRNNPLILHLYFVNDLLLFREASCKQIRAFLKHLNMLYLSSSEVVSVDKTKILLAFNGSKFKIYWDY